MVGARVKAVLRRLGLVISGLLVVALTAGVAALGWWVPQPEPTELDVGVQNVGVGPTSWVCAPAPTLATSDGGDDLDYDPDLGTGGGAVATVVDLVAIGNEQTPVMTVGPVGGDIDEAGTAGMLATESRTGVADPISAFVEPEQSGVPLVGGVMVARTDAGDLRGLSATACQQPVTNAMLVGGSTQLGSSARLVLANPGETAASVTLTGWGATGPLPGVAPVVVPAGGVRQVLLQTISLEPRIAIQIDVEGGRVVPSIQDSSLDGIVAAGTETVGVAADPTTDLLLGPVPIIGADGASATLRLVNPNDEAATVTVETLGPDGAEVLEGAESSVIEAGTVVDISLAGPPNGRYGVRVTSDLPVSGAIQLARTGTAGDDDPDTPPVDVAWLSAADPVDRGVLPVPSDLVDDIAVAIANPAGAATEVAVTGYDATGETVLEESVTIEAGAMANVKVPDGVIAVVLEGDGLIASEIVTAKAADGALIAAFPIVPDPYSEQTVSVRVSS